MLLIVTEDGGLLLHHRDNKPEIPNPDCWAGFGGAVEDGETVEDAVRREVGEETGLQIADPIFLTEAVDHEGDGRTVSLFYIVGGVKPDDIDLHEGAGVGVHRIEDLPDLKMTPFVRRAIYSHLLPLIAERLAPSAPRPPVSAATGARRTRDTAHAVKDGAMSDRATQLAAFMAEYERAANSHDVRQVLPLIADDATYWFTDGSYRGREEIAGAFERTFATIDDEVYEIRELEWFALTDELAACRYRFSWRGIVDGQPSSGRGRGTNVVVKRDGAWQVKHEHLSD
jgi:ADP-ribose pyrophosphatase YjhB (NUDIX family)